ncbi:inosine triphosphate pyrophosphatase-like protein [Catenaria anguillulae PL171]|uniref:Inosine triphosphate pyrophosphatase-like protein n=1 Tax=Catenaria anguillulae PL171 TaxID=765915 RepID=A0A1Y2HNB7_9FUNG|nr:inosine triphosphate pyrophosphatase-like protein [Catenaria anguillulae PL171]
MTSASTSESTSSSAPVTLSPRIVNGNAGTVTIVLGSSSKWRRQLISSLLPNSAPTDPAHAHIRLDFASPDIDEKSVALDARNRNDAAAVTTIIAHAKADALVPVLREKYATELKAAAAGVAGATVLLITSDQVIVCNGEIREKPETPEMCKAYMKSYGHDGHPAECVNGIVVTNLATGARTERVVIGKQYWNPVPEPILDKVIGKGDIMHCAGGFMIDEPLLHPFVGRRDADEDVIMGMPLRALKDMIEENVNCEL